MQKFSFAKSVVIMVIYKYNSFLLLVIKMKGCVCVLKWLKCHFHPLFLLPNLAVLQITHEKYLNILHVPGHTTIFHRDVAHALFWCNQYEMEELLHWRLGTIVVSYLIFFFFLSFILLLLFCSPPKCDVINVRWDCFLDGWLIFLAVITSKGGEVISTSQVAQVEESHLLDYK